MVETNPIKNQESRMIIDPEGVELAALGAMVTFGGARVLEIGCGDGRLARRYAPTTRLAVGLDHAADPLKMAVASAASAPSLRFVRGTTALPFRGGTFDVALFGWSL